MTLQQYLLKHNIKQKSKKAQETLNSPPNDKNSFHQTLDEIRDFGLQYYPIRIDNIKFCN